MPRLSEHHYDPDEDREPCEPPWADSDFVDDDRERMAERGAYDDTMERWAEADR